MYLYKTKSISNIEYQKFERCYRLIRADSTILILIETQVVFCTWQIRSYQKIKSHKVSKISNEYPIQTKNFSRKRRKTC